MDEKTVNFFQMVPSGEYVPVDDECTRRQGRPVAGWRVRKESRVRNWAGVG